LEPTTSLADLLGEYQGIEAGYHPDDNPVNVPETSALAIAAIATVLIGPKRRQRRIMC
jgi:hypothetical protein